jgi:hypothetical protein
VANSSYGIRVCVPHAVWVFKICVNMDIHHICSVIGETPESTAEDYDLDLCQYIKLPRTIICTGGR